MGPSTGLEPDEGGCLGRQSKVMNERGQEVRRREREARLTLSTLCKDPVASTENIIDTSFLGGFFFAFRLAKGKSPGLSLSRHDLQSF